MQTRIRIAGMIIQDGKLLLLRGRGHPELWTPGGKLETGESDEECLRRELKEEIGVKPVSFKFMKEYSGPSFYRPKEIFVIQRAYITEVKGTPRPAAEIDECIWVEKESLNSGKYFILPSIKEKIIPDLITLGFW